MAHTYAIVKSWVDQGRPGVHCGYVNITMADDSTAGVYSITASAINPNLSTLYQLSPVGGAVGAGDVVFDLHWSYADQTWTAYDMSDGAVTADVDALDDAVIYCYYEGS